MKTWIIVLIAVWIGGNVLLLLGAYWSVKRSERKSARYNPERS